jgi:hypothetical protein
MIENPNNLGNIQTEQKTHSQQGLVIQLPCPLEELPFLRAYVETLPNGLIADEI